MPTGRSWLAVAAVVTLTFWCYVGSGLSSTSTDFLDENTQVSSLRDRIITLEKELNLEHEALRRLKDDVLREQMKNQQLIRADRVQPHPKLKSSGVWQDPIPVLVFACNREEAIRTHVSKLISLRTSPSQFPIIVSQDCDSEPTTAAIKSFGDQVTFVKHLAGDKANMTVPDAHKRWTTYYRISRHYKLALEYVFGKLGHTSVIITEDDLDVSPDFFEYFAATRYLLEEDKSLFCVSAWNDNGKPHNIDPSASSLLYRSDFFPGLGWMMAKTLWTELAPIWPAGFWDDWIREPERRRDRACIRPEISRTAMTRSGKKGASEGLFFTKHLIKIKLNEQKVDFANANLDYLKKEKYDPSFEKAVYQDAKPVSIEDVIKEKIQSGAVRVYYNGNLDYIRKADRLQIMHDFKAGVPRTAYKGVVSAFVNGLRVYLVPNATVVHGYDKKWEVPIGMD